MSKSKIGFFVIAFISIIIAAVILLAGGKKSLNLPGAGKPDKLVLNVIGTTGSSGGFFEDARREFMSKNPDIEINYIKGLGTFDAVEHILKGNDVDGWICADETGTQMLQKNYEKENNGENIVVESTPIITSPLVIMGWEERLNQLGSINISTLYDIVSKGKTWQSLGGQPGWGFVNFSHTNPIESNSGIQFITLLIHNYYQNVNTPKKDLKIEDIANEKLVEYIKAFEKNTAKQEGGSGKFMESMVLYGPSRYDMGAIYEYYALSNVKNAKGRWGNLKIIYPNPTIWSNRPFVILQGERSSKEKIAACKKFRDYLLKPEVQQKAMLEGYRPVSSAVTDLSYLQKEYGVYGFVKDIPSAVPAPEIEVIESIQSLIKRIQ